MRSGVVFLMIFLEINPTPILHKNAMEIKKKSN